MNIDEYCQIGHARYAEFCEVVAAILTAAITAHDQKMMFQPIQRRAKDSESLRKKLPQRSKIDPEKIEDDIKDLAG
ncbi:MAG: hypothetical protein OJJ21_16460 [Ferrovibrio sp.]|uniref:hypothetical protein n=1 Tax=Ferrovibrio sp. TaxID=1917215 RepID=UPI002629A30E|nr:hypothetical protein [Ferrovibrio sp.]MCW0235195.1 hypothetical protein [Ferrovibrio sp.]